MNISAEYWEERCELAERVVEVAIKSPIETLPLANRIVEWINFKRTTIICDDVNEECSEEQREQAKKWMGKIDLNKLKECDKDVVEMLDTEGLIIDNAECPPVKWLSDLSEQADITEALDRCGDYYKMITKLKRGNQNDTKDRKK